MDADMRQDEFRVTIRSLSEESGGVARFIPAHVLKDSINTIVSALKAANRELHSKKNRSEFFISHLELGSNVYGIFEQKQVEAESCTPCIDLFRSSAFSVYRSEHERVIERHRIVQSLIKVGSAIDERYPAIARFQSGDLPLDGFFAKQAMRLKERCNGAAKSGPFYAGNAIGAFDGRLENLDYRGGVWRGHLVLPGNGAQIECIFDSSRGEDYFNHFGHKRVSVSGRAIYTGDSQLPERVEVVSIEKIDLALEARDIRGTLKDAEYRSGWARDSKNFQ
ncbi:MAG: hypothetical protein IOC63_12395 [Methylobacterium sp.]|nr:hypothetical protein [Methylobacterium sp.]